ncbi:hypothetical protein VTJ04DRAFT_5854 [Mycothermus thermophilus]|uniref:uncharacterized protein n=1 Tax=Humicola insolens TaxID=85995 RepID=UPI00374247DC
MLTDREIDQAAAQLAKYRNEDELSRILDQYAVLIEKYKRLKSDYEEEREAREKYKQMARDQERNPFVLVLVDGDGYVFKDSLLAKRADGGSEAAQLLNDEVKASLRRRGLEHCQIMIRIYANVLGLSKALHKTGIVGGEARSLSPFIASFNRSYGLTEFVDAGELKENADFKLRALLRLYAENSQCKHIYFAACHDVGYVSELTPYMGHSSKFTLVDTPGVRFHDEFKKLGMGIEEFTSVFRGSPVDASAQYRSTNGTNGGGVKLPSSPVNTTAPSALAPTKKIDDKKDGKKIDKKDDTKATKDDKKHPCLFFTIGKCRYGKSCRMLHENPAAQNGDSKISAASPPATPVTTESTTGVPDILAKLPRKHDIPPGQVPINDNNFRLDCYLGPVSAEVQNRLKSIIEKRKLCNSYHLQGSCDIGDKCPFGHTPIEPELLPALELLARSQPCPRRGACRLEGCTHGHICQNPECKYRGGKVYCRLPVGCHREKLVVAEYVPSVSKQGKRSTSTSSEDNYVDTTGYSVFN